MIAERTIKEKFLFFFEKEIKIKIEKKIVLFYFGRRMSTNNVEKIMKLAGYKSSGFFAIKEFETKNLDIEIVCIWSKNTKIYSKGAEYDKLNDTWGNNCYFVAEEI